MEEVTRGGQNSAMRCRASNNDVGLGGFGVPCSPRDPKFAGSNPAEVDGFFSGRTNPEHKFSGRDFKLDVPSLRFQAP